MMTTAELARRDLVDALLLRDFDDMFLMRGGSRIYAVYRPAPKPRS